MTTSTPSISSNRDYLRWEVDLALSKVSQMLATDGGQSPTLVSREVVVEARRQAVARGASIPFDVLARRYGLSADDEELLWTCLAGHLSARAWEALLEAQGRPVASGLSVGFLSTFAAVTRGGLGDNLSELDWCEPSAPLIKHGLVATEAASTGTTRNFLDHLAFCPQYLVDAVRGKRGVDARVATVCALVQPRHQLFEAVLPDATRKAVEGFVTGFCGRARAPLAPIRPWTVLVTGPAGCGKTVLVDGLARALGRPVLRADVRRLMASPDCASRIDLVAAHARFHDAVLQLVWPEENGAAAEVVEGLLERHDGLTVLEARRTGGISPGIEARVDFAIEIGHPDLRARTELWESHVPADLPLGTDVAPADLAVQYELSGRQIATAAAWARQRASAQGSARLCQRDLGEAARAQVGSKLGSAMKQQQTTLGLSDLVLDEATMAKILELRDACRARARVLHQWGFGQRLGSGRGLAALFHGKPGTGKTMCARILAAELERELLVVSIPDVVSKWVGETEKHLRDLFSEARSRNSLLLFDEADALFGTRVRVEKAQDQYANMQIDTLLQEIEQFDGVVVLTTNLESNLDKAFARRILFNVEFPEPDAEQRARIWQSFLPAEAPREDEMDFGLLGASFELSGGQIKNAVLRAAYRASARGRGLGMTELEGAARDEAKAAGKLIRVANLATR